MTFKRFFAAMVAAYVVGFLMGWLIHGVMLARHYMAISDLMRPEGMRWDYLILGYIAWSAGIAWLYPKGVEAGKPWLIQAIRFGLAVSAVAVVPPYFSTYATQPFPGNVISAGLVGDMVTTVVVSIVVALIYKGGMGSEKSKAAAA